MNLGNAFWIQHLANRRVNVVHLRHNFYVNHAQLRYQLLGQPVLLLIGLLGYGLERWDD